MLKYNSMYTLTVNIFIQYKNRLKIFKTIYSRLPYFVVQMLWSVSVNG